MADSNIQLPLDGAGKKVDTRTESTNSEHREVHVIGDPAANEGVAVVSNVDISGERYGLVVREANSTTIAIPMQVLGSGEANSNTLRTILATDAIASVQTKFTARQTNPTAVADAASALGASDDLGRQITRPVQARDLILTAYTTLSTGTEATLLTAAAATYADLIYIMGANESSAAVQVDIRAVSAGNIVMTLEIPANSTAGVALPVPFPQDATGNAWTVDMADITGTTVAISALFSKEV